MFSKLQLRIFRLLLAWLVFSPPSDAAHNLQEAVKKRGIGHVRVRRLLK